MPTDRKFDGGTPEEWPSLTYPYNATMEITVNGNTLPDPSEWNYQVGDLDTSGSRDATGMLHRAYVATKINYEFKWSALEWKMLQYILEAIQHEKFKMVAPDPRRFNKTYTGYYYVGDRTGSAKYFIPGRNEKATFDLKLKFIEY